MNRSARSDRSFVLKTLSFWVLVRVAMSYLEPGGTSFLLKILISCLAGAVLLLRQSRELVRLFIAKLFSRKPKQAASLGRPQATSSKRKSDLKQGQQIDEAHIVAKKLTSTAVMEEPDD